MQIPKDKHGIYLEVDMSCKIRITLLHSTNKESLHNKEDSRGMPVSSCEMEIVFVSALWVA